MINLHSEVFFTAVGKKSVLPDDSTDRLLAFDD